MNHSLSNKHGDTKKQLFVALSLSLSLPLTLIWLPCRFPSVCGLLQLGNKNYAQKFYL